MYPAVFDGLSWYKHCIKLVDIQCGKDVFFSVATKKLKIKKMRLRILLQGYSRKSQYCVLASTHGFKITHIKSMCILIHLALHTQKKGASAVQSPLCNVLLRSKQRGGFKEVSATDEIMLYRVCQHYLTSLSLISRAQGGAHLCVCLCQSGFVCVYHCVSRGMCGLCLYWIVCTLQNSRRGRVCVCVQQYTSYLFKFTFESV